jgi:hypothetical protein
MAGRLCPACRKNVDSPPDPNPGDERGSKFAVEQKRAGVAPSMKFQPDPPRSFEETIVPAPSEKAIRRRAVKYETYEQVPWHRKEPGALVFLLVLLCAPITVAMCVVALTGDVYRNAYDKDGILQVWGPGNKVAAVLILLIQCFLIWASLMIA